MRIAIAACVCFGCHGVDQERCLAALADVEHPRELGLKIALPSRYRGMTVDDTAIVFTEPDGATFLFGKTERGYKGNYEGFVCGPRALHPGELEDGIRYRLAPGVEPEPTRPLHDPEYAEPVKIRRGSDGFYRVYFDDN